MSQKFPGGIISKTAPVPTGPYENGTAPGIWTLEQQAEFVKQGIWPIAGLQPDYIEDVFSTYLYTGNGSTQTITNGIDLAGEGGLVWMKNRGGLGEDRKHILVDTVRGGSVSLSSNNTSGNDAGGAPRTFLSNGFSIDGDDGDTNRSPGTYASWTFRKQPKFFDVVTYTGNGGARTLAHNLQSVPGCIIIKKTSASDVWLVSHRATTNPYVDDLYLNLTDGAYYNGNVNDVTATSFRTLFNDNGATYVAYLFAHNAGGFGLTGTDNVISCGSFSTGSGNVSVTLGYEPQWVMYKRTDGAGNWVMFDTMRGWFTDSAPNGLVANDSAAEPVGGPQSFVNATGFNVSGSAGQSFIYIAIRRGPMKVPTTGTSVFSPQAVATDTVGATTGFPVDWCMDLLRGDYNKYAVTRLTGRNWLQTSTTEAEGTNASATWFQSNTGIGSSGIGLIGDAAIYECFRRAPGFFDVVCYTGTGSARNVAHNLAAVPELMIVKRRNGTDSWVVYAASEGATKFFELNLTTAVQTGSLAWNNTTPTSTVFSTGTYTNQNADTYVAYLFASCPGVSKVGSYTGTGTTQTINCGFTAGSRFVLIKRTDDTGDWYVWDSARGIIAGDDPYLLLNSTAAEVTNTDYVDTASTGFEISSTAPAAINASGGTFIFLAIA